MVRELNKTTVLTGKSGTEYRFHLWEFDDFDDVKATFQGGGLYLFTRREYVDGVYKHTYLYLGKTLNYFTRYDNHHKEQTIRRQQSNCIGFYPMSFASNDEMEEAENDILNNYGFPCNIANN